jgi:hypothetical protein
MRAVHIGESVRGAGDWLHLAAAPTFAAMALLTGMRGGGAQAMLCAPMQDVFPVNSMVLMYVLMSAFHLPPWLKLAFALRPFSHFPQHHK